MSGPKRCEFMFRVWVHPADPADIEVWYHGIESVDSKSRFVSEWARESLINEDFQELFGLDETKHWQVVGKGVIRGSFDYFGEYDEEFDVIEFEAAEVPESYFGPMEISE